MKRDQLISNLNQLSKYPNDREYRQVLYSHLVDMGWWSDTNSTDDSERKSFLYQAFFEYYNLISNGDIKEIEKDSTKVIGLRYELINLCKVQLDSEIERVAKKEYVRP